MIQALAAAGGIVSTIAGLVDSLHTSDAERLAAQIELQRIAVDAARVEADILAGVQATNQAEARHRSIFVAGWRPAVGWIGAASMAYQFLVYPLLTWGWRALQGGGWVPLELQPPPVIDTEALWVILSGMLGLAGARTVEKIKGAAQ